MPAFYVFKRHNNQAFHVYKPSTKHAASILFLFTLEFNAGTTMFINYKMNWQIRYPMLLKGVISCKFTI